MIQIISDGGDVQNLSNYNIIAFAAQPNGTQESVSPFCPVKIQRVSDGEIFAIGDRVTNGTAMCGKIIGFYLLKEYIYADHTYSGVAMCIDDLTKVPELPSKFQHGDAIDCETDGLIIKRGVVIKVHFPKGMKPQYDLQVWTVKGMSTRLYNVDESTLKHAK